MSATARRKQEEKHLRLVRELGARTPNRRCAECEQRGPTYTDITVGSFVCTSCSGILRGLNPPHRVKSISMTTFTEQEIEFLQSHGNEVCRQIWLGLFDSRSSVIPDYRDPQKIKEFLQDKYEKKRWYVPPERVKVSAATSATTSLSSRSSTPDIKPLKSLVGESTPALTVTRTPVGQAQVQQAQQQQAKRSQMDLLADIGGDPFATSAPQHAATQAFGAFPGFGVQQTAHASFPTFNAFSGGGATGNVGGFPSVHQAPFQAQPAASGGSSSANFANFDTFPKSSSTSFGAFTSPPATSVPAGSTAASSGKHATSQADKYAALADLESIFNAPNSTAAGGQMSSFSFTSAGQPAASSSQYTGGEYSSVFGIGVPSSHASAGTNSISGTVSGSQVPTQQSVATSTANFGAFSNPFAAPTVTAQAASTNPFQTNGMAPVYGVQTVYGSVAPTAVPGGFVGFPQHPFSQQQQQQQQPHPQQQQQQQQQQQHQAFGQQQSYPQQQQQQQPFPVQQGYSQQQHAFAQQQAFLQQQAFAQQHNGAGFAAFGQPKVMQRPMGPLIQGGGAPSNPFMTGAPPGQFAAGNTSTNPFL
ncbi:arf-GAP domain and FG repeat-containing protein 1-like isoform X3 [Leucoraja erinacea]|uniref:arf-GAP domain and FG repeat-containing protein 1-like isoform X3 n=1 Tax=Leucoraja erinaceus TaxID=7782 RepID=UPI002458FD69|nr:arf-GAP domain and FG repeat-containing protein 1-like isoform X3 [Leucoraja erinacea]